MFITASINRNYIGYNCEISNGTNVNEMSYKSKFWYRSKSLIVPMTQIFEQYIDNCAL